MDFKQLLRSILLTSSLIPGIVFADTYIIDTKAAHAFIQFRIQHLGYSWLYGRFNEFSGSFTFDEKRPNESKVEVLINTGSVDSNHAERDKHLRGDDFLDVKKFPEARFVSTSFKDNGDGTAVMTGDFTLHGVTKELTVDVVHVGHGDDPWGGYRRGFEGKTRFSLVGFDIKKNLGPASQEVELTLSIEGIRQ